MTQPSKRIGIISGSFDPVHKGHIAFALAAAEVADLDMVYFAPEVHPRRKPHVSHFGHRLAMLRLATRPYKNLDILELPDRYFLPKVTLPRLQQKFPDARLVLLMGSDLFEHMASWPHVELLLPQVGLLVGARGTYEVAQVLEYSHKLPRQPLELQVIDSVERQTSSTVIRADIAQGKTNQAIVESVASYAKKHWLYHDISSAKKKKLLS